jgi:hypothetical protein
MSSAAKGGDWIIICDRIIWDGILLNFSLTKHQLFLTLVIFDESKQGIYLSKNRRYYKLYPQLHF